MEPELEGAVFPSRLSAAFPNPRIHIEHVMELRELPKPAPLSNVLSYLTESGRAMVLLK